MGFLDRYFDTERAKEIRLTKPSDVFAEVLKRASGTSFTRRVLYGIYYQIYGFYGVVDGVGTSTIVANVALGLAEAGLTVCVIDTSVLAPTQDVLLNTDEATYNTDPSVKHYDWFDMPFTRESVLHVSKHSHNISVLSFKGGHRGIVDFMSPNDSEQLVTLALSSLQNKFDIILIDCCHEMTSVNTACLQQAQQVIQVWNDSPTVVGSLESFITNAITLSCPLDKMRYVVYNRISNEAMGSLDNLLNQYRLKHLGTSYFSEELYLKIVTGKNLYRCESTDPLVIDYTEFIIRIICHILNIKLNEKDETSGTPVDEVKDVPEDTIYSRVLGFGKKLVGGTAPEEVKDGELESPDEEPELESEESEPDDFEPDEEDEEADAELEGAKAYAAEAMKFGGVLEEDDVKAEELTDTNNDGVADIFDNPDKPKPKRKRKRNRGGKKAE